MQLKAEVIAIGDELTSGQRLDTNTQWLSHQLGELGVSVAFHSTVGDDLGSNIEVFQNAGRRADLVISTGGLGPTADDLTRQAIADAAGVELEFHPHVLTHILGIFKRFGREMPENNRAQAYFPIGARIVDNPEGTAPGIDFDFPRESGSPSRIFALPGVPAEMKQMWTDTIEPELRKQLGMSHVIHHQVLHCFGVGESQAETMLPHIINREREPRVGITASAATISFRVSARAQSTEACIEQMQPTIDEIREVMGSYVFGENNVSLQEVVHRQLRRLDKRIAIFDAGLFGDVARSLLEIDDEFQAVLGGIVVGSPHASTWTSEDELNLAKAARKVRSEFGSDIGMAIGSIEPATKGNRRATFKVFVESQPTLLGSLEVECTHGGHSSYRHAASVKRVLNQLRLMLEPLNQQETKPK